MMNSIYPIHRRITSFLEMRDKEVGISTDAEERLQTAKAIIDLLKEPSMAQLIAGNHCQPGKFSAELIWDEMVEASLNEILNEQLPSPAPIWPFDDPKIWEGEE